jgi:hypothetical protein
MDEDGCFALPELNSRWLVASWWWGPVHCLRPMGSWRFQRRHPELICQPDCGNCAERGLRYSLSASIPHMQLGDIVVDFKCQLQRCGDPWLQRVESGALACTMNIPS